jgi:hypothetical protein
LLPLFLGCNGFDNSEIDQEYLQSNSFADFQQDVAFERQRKAYKNAPINEHLRDFASCNRADTLTLPFTFDEQLIKTLSNKAPSCIVENEMMSIKLLAITQSAYHTVRWVLVDYQTSYRDQQLVMSAYRDGNLRSFKTVGIFKENLSEHIRSKITVNAIDNGMGVSSETVRRIEYPFEQKSTVRAEYKIDKQGGITQS